MQYRGSGCRHGMKAIAVIVAAGGGTRFGARKQFVEVAGKPLYYYSIKAFRPYVDRTILVVPEEDVDRVEPYGAAVIAGGRNRYDSVYNAIKAIDDVAGGVSDDTVVMIHDGARPCITSEVIEKVIADTLQYDAAVPTVPVTDTIRTVDGELMDRSKLRAMQTPQSFRYGLLKASFDKLMGLPEEAIASLHITDDVQVVYQMSGTNAHMTEGDPRNIKVTTPNDIESLHIS